MPFMAKPEFHEHLLYSYVVEHASCSEYARVIAIRKKRDVVVTKTNIIDRKQILLFERKKYKKTWFCK